MCLCLRVRGTIDCPQDILDDVTVAGRGRSPAMLATRNLLYQTYQITMQGATEGPSALPPYVANSRHRYFRDCMAFMQVPASASVTSSALVTSPALFYLQSSLLPSTTAHLPVRSFILLRLMHRVSSRSVWT